MTRVAFAVSALGLWILSSAPVPAGPPLPARGPAYIGAERCGGCHAAEYEQWRKTPHARAHLSLPPERRSDTKCTGCHAPDPGGLFPAVQCESCHGAGRDYAYDFVMHDAPLARQLGLTPVNERRCRTCHTGDGPSGPFDYAAKLRSVVHRPR